MLNRPIFDEIFVGGFIQRCRIGMLSGDNNMTSVASSSSRE